MNSQISIKWNNQLGQTPPDTVNPQKELYDHIEYQKHHYQNVSLSLEQADLVLRLISISFDQACGYGVFWKEKGQECSSIKGTEAEALEFALKLSIPGASIERIYRGKNPLPG